MRVIVGKLCCVLLALSVLGIPGGFIEAADKVRGEASRLSWGIGSKIELPERPHAEVAPADDVLFDF